MPPWRSRKTNTGLAFVTPGVLRVARNDGLALPLQAQNVGNDVIALISGQNEVRHVFMDRMEPCGKAHAGYTWRIRDIHETWRMKIGRELISLPDRMTLGANFIGISKTLDGIAGFLGARRV